MVENRLTLKNVISKRIAYFLIKQFSIERHKKTNTKIITLANHKARAHNNQSFQLKLEAITCSRQEARQNCSLVPRR